MSRGRLGYHEPFFVVGSRRSCIQRTFLAQIAAIRIIKALFAKYALGLSKVWLRAGWTVRTHVRVLLRTDHARGTFFARVSPAHLCPLNTNPSNVYNRTRLFQLKYLVNVWRCFEQVKEWGRSYFLINAFIFISTLLVFWFILFIRLCQVFLSFVDLLCPTLKSANIFVRVLSHRLNRQLDQVFSFGQVVGKLFIFPPW